MIWIIPSGIIVLAIVIYISLASNLNEEHERTNFYRRFHKRYTSPKKETLLSKEEEELRNRPDIQEILKPLFNNIPKK